MPSRVDANQRPIVLGLRKIGALVLHLHTIRHGAPDLLVLFRGVFYLMEIKTLTGKLTPDEITFHAIWPVHIVRSLADALAVLGLLVLCAVRVDAQPVALDALTPPLPTVAERRAADVVSWATAIAPLVLDTRASWMSPDKVNAFTKQGIRLGITYGAAQLIKLAVHRQRPCAPLCGHDDAASSFPSLHTAFACTALGGPGLAVVVPLAAGTAGLRIAADKHWLTDVLTGCALGALTSRIR